MHELTVATNILEIAAAEAEAAAATVIRCVRVEVGRLSGVEAESLRFCFDLARRGTLADEAELDITVIEGHGRCGSCSIDLPIDLMTPGCPRCGGGLEIMRGRELRVCSIDVD